MENWNRSSNGRYDRDKHKIFWRTETTGDIKHPSDANKVVGTTTAVEVQELEIDFVRESHGNLQKRKKELEVNLPLERLKRDKIEMKFSKERLEEFKEMMAEMQKLNELDRIDKTIKAMEENLKTINQDILELNKIMGQVPKKNK